jgi:hypothetical protein
VDTKQRAGPTKRRQYSDVLAGILRLHISGYALIDSNAVWLTTAQLAAPVLAHLYRYSAAYLCSSLAEGQNPLLQEAMAWAAVPITTRHTAMLDCICEDNAVISARNGVRSTGRTRQWAPTRMRAGMFARAPMSRAHCGTLPGSTRLEGGSWAHGRAPRSPASSPSPRLLG